MVSSLKPSNKGNRTNSSINSELVSIITPCFRGELFLQGFFESVLKQTVLNDIELVLVHNDPSPLEINLVESFNNSNPGILKHIIVNNSAELFSPITDGTWAKETIAQTMNRAIINASGKYLALWNVDDLRTENSLQKQINLLKNNTTVDCVYADFIKVKNFGETDGVLAKSPDFDRSKFLRSCFGGFQMFRKSICNSIGYFDEQFRSGADFDFWIRIAANGSMKRCKIPIGFWRSAGENSSASHNPIQPIERTVIELRYGIYDKIDYRYLHLAQKHYRIDEIYFNNQWHHVSNFIPDYVNFINLRKKLKFRALLNNFSRIANPLVNRIRRKLN